MNDDLKNSGEDRRTFLKSLSATAVTGGLGVSQVSCAEDKAVENNDTHQDLHICRGLNTSPEGGFAVGECDATNIPAEDLHGCAGGNTCKGLGGCGTGDYATQYWVSENLCGRSGAKWTGAGGCGVPIGSTNTGFICSQMNNAVPTPGENPQNKPLKFVGVPVWAIARARFEAKMVEGGKGEMGKKVLQDFGAPKIAECGGHMANSFKKGDTYDPGNLPEPYPAPVPQKKKPT